MRNSRERIETLERFIKKKSDFKNITNILNSIKKAAYNKKPIADKILKVFLFIFVAIPAFFSLLGDKDKRRR